MVVVHNHNNNNNDETRIRPSKLSNDTAPTTTTTTTTTSILYSERRDDIQTKSFSVANRHRNKSQQLRISNPMRRTKRKRQRSNFNKYNDESFLWLFLRVGFVVCFIGYTSYQTYHRLFHVQQQQQQQTSISTDDDNDMMSFVNTDTSSSSIQHPEQPQLFQLKHDAFRNGQTSLGSEFLNEWNVSTYALQFDAYAIAELYAQQQQQQSHLKQPDDSHQTTNDLTLFWQAAAGLRTQFAELYGGTNAARAILDRATTTFGGGGGGDTSHDPDRATATTSTTTTALLPVLPSDLSVTACRIWSSRQTASTASRIDTGHNGDIRSDNIPTFRFAFGGYSVTVGRGNLFSQSFPFIMEQQLQTVFSLLGIQLLVRNAAM